MLMNVYLVSDLQNINPGIGGTSKNPHFYDTTFDNLEPTQVLSFSGVPTGGSFALSYNSQTTGTITYATGSGGLTATTIQSELDALSSIIALGGVSVSGTTGGTSFTITFNRANIDYGQISATSVALTGGTSPSASVTNVYQTAAVGDGVGLGSEVLTFSTAPTAGTFTLSYNSQTTGSISASGLTALVIQNALDSLSSVAALGGVTVTGTSSATTYTITFNDAYLGDAYGQISGSSNLTSNSGNTAVTLSVSNPFQWGTGYLLGTITNPSSVYWNGYVDVPMTTFSASAETALINDLNNGNEFRILLSPATPNTGLNGDLIYNYTNANQSYAADTGLPLNYYIQPELSFDVSYASNGGFAALPAYITPSANADYIYDSGTNTLTLTNGSLTFTKSSLSAGASAINVDVVGPTASIYFSAASGYTSQNLSLGSLTLSGGAFAQITPNTGALTVTSLSIGTGCSLDVTNNHMYIDYGSNTDPKSSILSYLVTGSNGGTWSGQGIFSSTAATTTGYGVGYSDGADGIDSSLTSGEIEVAYAQYGDITLSGLVNAQDFSDLTAHFGKTTSNGWEVGDFYYTGQVNGADFSLLTANFGKTGSGEDVSTPPAPSDDAGTVSTPSVVTESTPTTAAVVAAPTITTATSSDSTTSAPLVVDDKPKKKSKPAVAAVIFSADGSTPGALQDVDGDKKFFSGQ
jgi:hypothetical protein